MKTKGKYLKSVFVSSIIFFSENKYLHISVTSVHLSLMITGGCSMNSISSQSSNNFLYSFFVMVSPLESLTIFLLTFFLQNISHNNITFCFASLYAQLNEPKEREEETPSDISLPKSLSASFFLYGMILPHTSPSPLCD